ncbi:MAG: hypothetical protein JW708_11795, partial [Vallitaleaceae bacterium]|nr:hypothetical protein [Vallitaleaceae bacterium]
MQKWKVLLISLLLFGFVEQVMVAETEIEVETEAQLIEISEEESLILDTLQEFQSSIEAFSNEVESIEASIKETNDYIEETKIQINGLQESFKKKIAILAEVLVLYQKKGSTGFLETLLSSESISDFLKRLDIVRDLSRNTDNLLRSIEEEKEQYVVMENDLQREIILLEEKKLQLEIAISEKEKAMIEKEAYLSSLQEERGEIETLLKEIQLAWEEALVVFAETSKEFENLLTQGAFPEEALELQFGLSGIEARIQESVFNQVLVEHQVLQVMQFRFEENKVFMIMEGIELELEGKFEVYEDFSVIYRPIRGSFYGLELREDSLLELSQASELILDLESVLLESKLSKVYSDNEVLILEISFS